MYTKCTFKPFVNHFLIRYIYDLFTTLVSGIQMKYAFEGV